ncbi:hypothetical protein BofuT4_uP143730.1 [Botrytis cinerea T4]|uniref:Uncharacterized protein n=1 Tax=Botryotinia fuckeliana (strain T4) TaxID=999810 RepID=G2YY67_BOTF4|nr:hypothetical protein BofuT4_uP143730.1 [Botrytis cinerea T4]
MHSIFLLHHINHIRPCFLDHYSNTTRTFSSIPCADSPRFVILLFPVPPYRYR